MIDKLRLTTEHTDFNLDYLNLISTNVFTSPDKHYYNCMTFKSNDRHLCTIKWEPRSFGSLVTIILNPSNFNSFFNLLEIISATFPYSEPKDFKIRRLDMAYDMSLPIEDVYQSIRILYKQDREIYKQIKETHKGLRLTGFYIGKTPEVINIYDKSFLNYRDKKITYQQFTDAPVTRYEIRYSKNKVPIKTLNELPDLVNFDIFRNIKIYEYKVTQDKKLLFTQNIIKETAIELGFHIAFKLYNKKNNAHRLFSHIAYESNILEHFREDNREKLRQYFLVQNVFPDFSDTIKPDFNPSTCAESLET